MPYTPKPKGQADLTHHTLEWTSGARGGGFVPADFEWGTNPKQHQEENGSSALEQPKAAAVPKAP